MNMLTNVVGFAWLGATPTPTPADEAEEATNSLIDSVADAAPASASPSPSW